MARRACGLLLRPAMRRDLALASERPSHATSRSSRRSHSRTAPADRGLRTGLPNLDSARFGLPVRFRARLRLRGRTIARRPMATDGAAQSWIRPALRALAGRRGRNELAYQKPMARFPRRALGFPAVDCDDSGNCWLKSRNTHNWPTAVAVDQGTSRAARPGAGSSLHSTNGKPRVGNSKLITQTSKLARGAHSSLKNSRYSSARSTATASMIRRPASTVASSGWEPIRPSG